MDDTQFGERNSRGDWVPFDRIKYPPMFSWPIKPMKLARWFVSDYLLSWNLAYAGLAMVFWFYLTPPMEILKTIDLGWVTYLFIRNAALVFLFFGAWHLRLYMQKKQGNSFKYNGNWLATDKPVFLFRNQVIDNLIWTFASAVPIWTAFEVLMLWAYANGFMPIVSWADNPVYFGLLMLAVPLFRDVHFYVTHRLIHWPPLYRTVHKLHHKNVNVGPWSGLAMHPVEHLLYFSGALIHFVVPAHPIHILFQLLHAALSPAQGHSGFDKIVIDKFGKERTIDLHAYAHYLHHKYFVCNYADGVVPLDKWFGTFHDGTPKAQKSINERLRARNARKSKKM